MATIKSYTNLEQSKKLAEILPVESADMRFVVNRTIGGMKIGYAPMIGREPSMGTIPCWSLAALLTHLPAMLDYEGDNYYMEIGQYPNGEKWFVQYPKLEKQFPVLFSFVDDSLVDVCYEIILKLHKQKLL